MSVYRDLDSNGSTWGDRTTVRAGHKASYQAYLCGASQSKGQFLPMIRNLHFQDSMVPAGGW